MSNDPTTPKPTATPTPSPDDYRGPDADTLHDYDLAQFRADRAALDEDEEEPTPTGGSVEEEATPVPDEAKNPQR